MFTEFLPAAYVPFPGIAPWAIACVFAAHFFGCFVRGTFGFGSNLAIVLLTTWLLGPHHAILLALMSTLVAQAHLLPQGLKTADWPVARPLLAGLVVGLGIGTWLFVVLASDWLTLILGILVILVLAMDRTNILARIAARADIRTLPIAGSLSLVAGIIGAVAGGGAFYFLVFYLKLACKTPERLRGTNLLLSAMSLVARVTFIVIAGVLSWNLATEAALLVPAIFLGTWSGTRYFHASSPERFFMLLQGLLLFAALSLVIKGLLQVA
jgi:uncharacterized membrane protein YfcA